MDYDEFTSLTNPLVAFTSDPSTHRQCFNVNITDDGILEDTERFSLHLTLADSNVPVLVNPEISEVEIIDKDCKYDDLILMNNDCFLSLQFLLLDLRPFSPVLVKR